MPKSPLEEEIDKVLGREVALSLTVYVRDNLADILAQIAKGVRYAVIAEVLGRLGVRDANGKSPTRAALYERVKAEKARRGMAQPRPIRPLVGRSVKRKHSSEVL